MTKSKMQLEIARKEWEISSLKKENQKLKELLDAELKAKENGCHRGNYCRGCVHGIVVENTCYCTFGQCDNFQKDPNYDNNEFFIQGG
jgi:hypothetical protein